MTNESAANVLEDGGRRVERVAAEAMSELSRKVQKGNAILPLVQYAFYE
jgi:hypothetical protein